MHPGQQRQRRQRHQLAAHVLEHRVDALSISGTTIDRDLVYLTAGTIQFIWGKTGYTSLTAFRTRTPRRSRTACSEPALRRHHRLPPARRVAAIDSATPARRGN
jgi:hypothetical protein